MNTEAEISALPAKAARMLAVEILLADPEALKTMSSKAAFTCCASG